MLPLDIEVHRICVPDAVPSLGSPVGREVDHWSSSSDLIQDGSPNQSLD